MKNAVNIINIRKFFIQIYDMDERLKFLVQSPIIRYLRRNFMTHFRELPEDQGGIICIHAQV